MKALRPRRTGRDSGESLLELIITMMIMGIAVPAVIAAVLAAVASSSQDRRQVQAQQLLTSWSETIAQANDDDLDYTACPALNYYATSPFAPATVPSGFHVSVASIDYWDPDADSFLGCGEDEGVRRLLLRVDVDAGLYPTFAVDRYVIVRKSCPTC